MGSKETELMAVLKKNADEYGQVNGNPAIVREWIGEHASDWDIHEMLVSLSSRGLLPQRAYIDGLGQFQMTFPI